MSKFFEDTMQGLLEAISLEKDIEELANRLENIPDAYPDFILGVLAYAKKKPERLKRVMDYINSKPDITSSDIVGFVMGQDDFHEDSACDKDA